MTYSIRFFFAIVLFSLVSLFSTTKAENKKCLILALQGGGDHGAYQAGVLKGLANNLSEEDRRWDIITGISAGTLNGIGFSIFPHGKEIEAADYLENVWRSIDSKDKLYKNWKNLGIFGPAYALFSETGLYDTSPLRELINKVLSDKEILRDLHIGITNIETGEYEVIEAKTLSKKDLVDASLASSAVPIIFPAIEFKGKMYQDGGLKHGIDILSGINECKEKGFEEKDIVVDIIKCFNKEFQHKDPTKFNSVESFLHWLSIWNKDRSARDIDDIIRNFKEVNFRYLIAPSKELPNSIALFFKKEEIELMFSIGEEDAKNAVIKINQEVKSNNNFKNSSLNEHNFFHTTTKKAVPNSNKPRKSSIEINRLNELKFLDN